MERTRINLKTTTTARKFVNVLSMLDNDNLFRYKVTLEGFRKDLFEIMPGAIAGPKGLMPYSNKPIKISGPVEISYHQDGNVMYKFKDKMGRMMNASPVKKLALSDIKPGLHAHFLRTGGFIADRLKKAPMPREAAIEFKKIDCSRPIGCDFFLTDTKTRVIDERHDSPFENSEFFVYDDRPNDISLHLRFYNMDVEKPYFMIPT